LPRSLVDLLFRSFEAREAFVAKVTEIRDRHPNRPLAFALSGGGLFEFLALRLFMLDRFGPSFELGVATRLPTIYMESLGTIFRRVASFFGLAKKPPSRILACSRELSAGRPVLLFFGEADRESAFQAPRSEKDLAYLAQQNPDLLIIPVVFIWRRAQRVERDYGNIPGSQLVKRVAEFSPWSLLLGDPYHPTGLRKLAIMLRQYGRSTLRLLEPMEISSWPPKALRRRILMEITQEKRTILGPAYRSPKLIGESILRDPGFQNAVRSMSAEEGVDELQLLKRAGKYFVEISAKYSFFVIETMGFVLDLILSTIYEDVTLREEDFEKLRAAAREGPLVILPCHRSYFDFLLVSYIMFRHDLLPPHIAAGINMNFWPFGRMFRGAGAFFIRRSFRGNRLYSEVLRRYVASLLSNRFNVEFFIEGARSRSGKLSPPKYGMLKMIMDSYSDGLITEKIRVVPVSLSYDRVTESRSHKRELEGGEKVQEDVFKIITAGPRVLMKRYGKVHIRFADPISLEEWTEKHVGGESAGDSHIRRLATQKLAFEVCHRINSETPLTGTGLLCAVLLAKPGCAMAKTELEQWLTRMRADLELMNIPLNPDLKDDYLKTCRRALARLLDEKIVERYHLDHGVGLRIPHKQRVAALYYKNSAIHALLIPGIAGIAQRHAEQSLELRGLLQFEFFFAEKEAFMAQVSHLNPKLMCDFYALMFDDVLENIQIGAAGLLANKGLWLDTKEWRNRLMKFARTKALESSIQRLESINTQSFGAFIEMAQNRAWLKVSPNQDNLFGPARPEDLINLQNNIRAYRTRMASWDELKSKYLPSYTT
jgi:glycerol-3-phosphate O-acyltransferase